MVHAQEEEQKTAARTKQPQGEEDIYIRKQRRGDKGNKERDKAESTKSERREKRKNRNQGGYSNMGSRLCYKTHSGALPHPLPPSSFRQ